MNAFVFLCQFVTSVSTLGNSYIYVDYDFTAIQFFQLAITTFYAIWNLDFFQFFIPSFCISSDMSTLHKLSLDYVVAIYPLLLTVIIYFCIEMYDSRVRVVVCVWSPFQMCLCSFQKEVGLQEISDQCFCCFSAAVIFKAAEVSYSLLAVSTITEVKELVQLYCTSMLQLSISTDIFHLLFLQCVFC